MARRACGAVLVLSAVALAAGCGSSGDKPRETGEAGAVDARQIVDARPGVDEAPAAIVDGRAAGDSPASDTAVRCDPARQPEADCTRGTPQWSCVPDENGGVWSFTCPVSPPDANLVDARPVGDAGGTTDGSPVDARADGAGDAPARCDLARRPEATCEYGVPAWTCVPDESGGTWRYTCLPTPVDSHQTDTLADALAADAAGECTKDNDCRLEGFYCKACECLALAPAAKAPVCTGPAVSCFVNPCKVMVARCQAQRCVAIAK